MSESDPQALIEAVRAALEGPTPLRIRGGGTKDFYGQKLSGALLETRGHSGVIAYSPSELVITARAGTPLAEIDACLAGEGQYLPFEPPQFAPGATLGGAVASGLAGPGRYALGSVRDFVLGARLIDGQARLLRFGGQVMKNVAGYDVSRALAGSLGTLGVIVDVSLKVLPRPQTSLTLCFEMSPADALEQMTQWHAKPLPITATAWSDGVLSVRLAGSPAAVDSARERLGGELIEPGRATGFWQDLRDQRLPFFDDGEPLWRLTLPAATPALSLAGSQCIEWSGTLRWLRGDVPAQEVRAATDQWSGHATLFRASAALKAAAGVFTPRQPAVAAIERRLKAVFDPKGIFNPGRIDAL